MTGATRQVVIVEDNVDSAEAIAIMFKASGYQVSLAHTARSAINTCDTIAGRGSVADLMLLDLTLPDGNGLSVLEAVTKTGTAPRVTAALTGHDDPKIVAACRAAGCKDVLLKPVSLVELITRAKEWTQ